MSSNTVAHIIDGREIAVTGSGPVQSLDPYTGQVDWSCAEADLGMVDEAVFCARRAFPKWSSMSLEQRISVADRFTQIVKADAERLAKLIAQEAGKPLWESKVEVNSLITKLAASIEAYKIRCSEMSREVRGLQSRTRFLPHGVVAVLGPFNFPASMANSHIMPALLAGNTVIFKPSELTPATGVEVAKIWQKKGAPPGVLSCLSGARRTGEALVSHSDVNGVFFVGSHAAGMSILKTLVDKPEKIVALEMGGNSPLVIYDYDKGKLDEVISIVVQSAYLSAGQRCSAARRLLIPETDERILPRLVDALNKIKIGHHDQNPEPYYGPLIRPIAAQEVLLRFQELVAGGGEPILTPTIQGPNQTLVSPGLIDVTDCKNDRDEEIFGPVLKVRRYATLPQAISIANDTKFGLAAGIVCRDGGVFEEFLRNVQAGIVNWNQQLTGATTFAPFGGLKQSGNHRPAGFLSADYCSYAVASFEIQASKLEVSSSPGLPW